MKKIFRNLFICILPFILILIFSTTSFAGNSQIKVIVNGEQVNFEVSPTIIKGNVLVPVKKMYETLGAICEWDGDTRTITCKKEQKEIVLKINDINAQINGYIKKLPVPPSIINRNSFAPIRFICESLGLAVLWDNKNSIATIDINVLDGELYNSQGELYYIGDYKDEKPNGVGKYYNSSGKVTSEGNFADGILNGQGKQYSFSGTLYYSGNFLNGLAHGKGKQYYENGILHNEGDWKYGYMEGKGKTYYESGKLRYQGDCKNNVANGQGINYWENGNVSYIGHYQDDKLNGFGKQYYYDDTLWYEGEWKNGLWDGQGTLYNNRGKQTYKGKFIEGKQVK